VPTYRYTLDADGAYLWRDARVLTSQSLNDVRDRLLAEYDPRDWDHATAQIGSGIWPKDLRRMKQRSILLVVTKIEPTNGRSKP
jgi:hypothetical protein